MAKMLKDKYPDEYQMYLTDGTTRCQHPSLTDILMCVYTDHIFSTGEGGPGLTFMNENEEIICTRILGSFYGPGSPEPEKFTKYEGYDEFLFTIKSEEKRQKFFELVDKLLKREHLKTKIVTK